MKATKKSKRGTSPFFTVKREKLYRANKKYTGYDVLFRADDETQLGVVSKQYKVITHREAVDVVNKALDKVEIKKRENKSEISYSGARLFHKVYFPDYKVDLEKETGVKGTALDSGSRVGELIKPGIDILNSYNGTSGFRIEYRVHRVWCDNGATVKQLVDVINVKHSGEINYNFIGDRIIEQLQATLDGVKKSYVSMNQSDGFDLFQKIMITDAWFSNRYNQFVFDMLGDKVDVEWEADEETGVLYPVGAKKKEEFSQYLLWCVLTDVISHKVHSAQHRHSLDGKVAKLFT